MGRATLDSLQNEKWNYVVLQEMSNGPITVKASFQKNVRLLCEKIRAKSRLFRVMEGYRDYDKSAFFVPRQDLPDMKKRL